MVMRRLVWRIRASATAAALLSMDAATAQQLTTTAVVNTTMGIERKQLHARVATYRNGFGTHFQCTATCYFLIWAYLACVAALLVLVFVIPVQTPMKPENAPFVLWLDSNQSPDQDDNLAKRRKQKRPKRQYGLVDRFTMWVYGNEEPESSESESERESSHTDFDLVPEPAEPVKLFESIGVETDDSLLPALLAHAEESESGDAEPPPPPTSPHEKKPGIFAPRGGSKEADDLPATDGEGAIGIHPRQPSVGAARRRSTVVGSASDIPGDNLLAAVERRTSMHKRAEKRKEYAKSDIAHDNLREHELHMYEYLEFVRSLLEGLSLKKITQKGGKVVKRTFFVTPNLATVYWNQVGNKTWVSKKSSIESTEISHVTKGADGASASRVNPEKRDLCLTIVTNAGKRVVLEATDEAMRQRLVLGFTRLAAEKKEEKRKRDAGEMDDMIAQQQEDGDQNQEVGALGRKEDPATPRVPSLEAVEHRAKSEEDDPQRWRDDRKEEAPDADAHEENQPAGNAVVVVSEEEEKEHDD